MTTDSAQAVTMAPPHDPDAEAGLIGSALHAEYGTSAYAAVSRAAAAVQPDDIYSPKARAAWIAATTLVKAGKPCDPITVFDRCRSAGFQVETKDVEEWSSPRFSPAHVEHYASIVHEQATRRRIHYLCLETVSMLQGGVESILAARKIESALTTINKPDTSGLFDTGEDIVAHAEESMRWVVECLVPAGTVVALVSEPKVGKTTLISHIVAALSRGGSCIGLDCAEAPGVVWLSEESRSTLRAPIERAGAGWAGLHVMHRAHMRAMTWATAIEAAGQKAVDTKSSLVIVDTFSAWAGLTGEQENQAGHVEAAIAPLKRLASTGVGVLVTHHLSKAPDRKGVASIRGSSAFAGAIDGFVLLRKEGGEDSPVRSLYGAGRGDGWANGIRYQLDPSGALVRMEGTRGASAALGPRIMQAVRASPGCSTTHVCSEVGGRKTLVLEAINDLERQSLLRVDRGGPGKPSLVWPA